MEIDPGWHVYWTNPGEAGLPTRLDWILPDGWETEEPIWPRPSRFDAGGVVGFGYAERLLVPLRVDVPADAPDGPVVLRAQVDWLACADTCVPGTAALELALEVRSGAGEEESSWAGRLDAARRRLPAGLPEGAEASAAVLADGSIRLSIRAGGEGRELAAADFFPEESETVELTPPAVTRSADGLELTFRRSVLSAGTPERLAGLLVPEDPGAGGWIVDVPVVVGTDSERL